MITYVPPSVTFSSDEKEEYHKIKIKVKRRNVQIYSRDGFFNRLEIEKNDAEPDNPLFNAIYSPFQYADLNVNMAAGYVKDAKAGYLVRSWMHIDPYNVKIIETSDGRARIDLEILCMTSDINGIIQDSKRAEFSLYNINSAEDIAWIRKHGISFAMLLPVKKPGTYYVHIAVQDKESGKVGSTYQFLEIHDVKKKRPVLSDIFMITSADDLNWMRSDVKTAASEGVFFPMLQGEEVRSPALRTYISGDKLQTLTMLYNADENAILSSEIEIQTILYKDGMEFLRGEPESITPDKIDNSGNIPLLYGFTIESNMPPGEYVLKILVIDKKNGKKKVDDVYQTLSFNVVEK